MYKDCGKRVLVVGDRKDTQLLVGIQKCSVLSLVCVASLDDVTLFSYFPVPTIDRITISLLPYVIAACFL